jgi:hypothetical protein
MGKGGVPSSLSHRILSEKSIPERYQNEIAMPCGCSGGLIPCRCIPRPDCFAQPIGWRFSVDFADRNRIRKLRAHEDWCWTPSQSHWCPYTCFHRPIHVSTVWINWPHGLRHQARCLSTQSIHGFAVMPTPPRCLGLLFLPVCP